MSAPDLAVTQIAKLVDEFKGRFQERTQNSDNFLTMSELEKLWGDLESGTKGVYSDMIREMLANVNEKELVRKKKPSSRHKASACAPTDEPKKHS